MTYAELKEAIRSYIDDLSGDAPTERDISILEALEDYIEPEGISEEEVTRRVNEAVEANTAEWTKKFKDRFYGRDEVAEESAEESTEETVVDTEVVTNEPEEEELKSVLDYEW